MNGEFFFLVEVNTIRAERFSHIRPLKVTEEIKINERAHMYDVEGEMVKQSESKGLAVRYMLPWVRFPHGAEVLVSECLFDYTFTKNIYKISLGVGRASSWMFNQPSIIPSTNGQISPVAKAITTRKIYV